MAAPAPLGLGETLFAQVNKAYQDVWKECPYTSFAMFNYLIKGPPGHTFGLGSWERFLRKQTIPTLETIGLTDAEVASPIPDELWNGKSGLCTSFAKRVETEGQQAGTFTFGDTTEHRAGKDTFTFRTPPPSTPSIKGRGMHQSNGGLSDVKIPPLLALIMESQKISRRIKHSLRP